MTTTVSEIVGNVFAVDSDDGVTVRALLVSGDVFTLLVDTLAKPSDLEAVRDFVTERGRPLLIANSHADWDHWWGNAAFPEAPVIAHRLTVQRQHKEGAETLAAKQQEDQRYAGIELRPATIAYEGMLRIDLGGIHVELSLVPGHVHDSTVAWVPERELLFAADAAEDPVPLVTEGPITGWPELLRDWAARASIVVPAHGAISGPELLTRNAAYLEGLFDGESRPVPELEGAAEFYTSAHERNLKKAAREAVKG